MWVRAFILFIQRMGLEVPDESPIAALRAFHPKENIHVGIGKPVCLVIGHLQIDDLDGEVEIGPGCAGKEKEGENCPSENLLEKAAAYHNC